MAGVREGRVAGSEYNNGRRRENRERHGSSRPGGSKREKKGGGGRRGEGGDSHGRGKFTVFFSCRIQCERSR